METVSLGNCSITEFPHPCITNLVYEVLTRSVPDSLPDRQTAFQTGRQLPRQADSLPDRQAASQTDRQPSRQADSLPDRQTASETGRRTDGGRYELTDADLPVFLHGPVYLK